MAKVLPNWSKHCHRCGRETVGYRYRGKACRVCHIRRYPNGVVAERARMSGRWGPW